MKYIEFPELSHLSRTLTHDSSECTVHTRIEAYSCKSVRHEKRLFKALEHSYAEDSAQHDGSPPQDFESAAFGSMDKHSSRKTLYLLIATLNTCFPDHDFSDLRPDDFRREESGAGVLSALSATIVQLRSRPNALGDVAPRSYSSYPPATSGLFPSSLPTSSSPTAGLRLGRQEPALAGTHPALYKMIDDIIGLADCDVFSYAPDVENDPHGGDADEDGSSNETESSSEEATFDFEPDYDTPVAPRARTMSHHSDEWSPLDDDTSSGPSAWDTIRAKAKQRGALLWSSHWFFHNRKMKRMLFITVWARKKSSRTAAWASAASAASERFTSWDGASGAGARALALGIAASI